MSRIPNLYRVMAVLFACAMQGAIAQNYPSKPIRLIAPASPGSGIDTLARTVGRELGNRLSQAVVIENMPGAGGNIASANIAHSAPDGYSLLLQISSFVINPSLYKKVPYDPIRDFQPITLAARGGQGMLVVNPSMDRVKTVKDLVAWSLANPGKLNYASPGFGTPPHLQMEIFKRMSGADFTHVPFKTQGETVNAILGGDVATIFMAANVAIPQARNAKLKILASTGQQRWVDTPEVPTMAESGFPDFKSDVWYGFLAPAGLAREVLRRLNAEFAAVLNDATTKESIYRQSLVATTSTPEEFAAVIRSDLAYWSKVIKDTGITID